MTRDELHQQIQRATKLVDARPERKRDILARSAQPTLSRPREPVIYRVERDDHMPTNTTDRERDLSDALRLAIGRRTNTPWRQIPPSEVEECLAEVRKLKRMFPDPPYHEVFDDDADAAPYATLRGPAGFECTLTEIEDRTWSRDLEPVVDRLNQMHQLLQEAVNVLESNGVDIDSDSIADAHFCVGIKRLLGVQVASENDVDAEQAGDVEQENLDVSD